MSGHMLRLANVTEFVRTVITEKNCGSIVIALKNGKTFIKVKSSLTLIKKDGTEAVVVNALV